jgi:hypothetical protein
MTVVFIVCIALSAICQTAEFGWLNQEYDGYTRLRVSYILKLLIVIAAVGTAIAMVSSLPSLWSGYADGRVY